MSEPQVFQARIGGSGLTHTARRVAANHLDAGRPIDGCLMEPLVLCTSEGQEVIGYDTVRLATGQTKPAVRAEAWAPPTYELVHRQINGKRSRVYPELRTTLEEVQSALREKPDLAGLVDEVGDVFVPEGGRKKKTDAHDEALALMHTLADGRPAFIFVGACNHNTTAIMDLLEALDMPMIKHHGNVRPVNSVGVSDLMASLVGAKKAR